MINPTYKAMLQGKSVIRELSEYATKRAQEIGADNVFDYSLGNPSVPTSPQFTQGLIEMLEKSDPVLIHGYSPSLGITSVRETIANSLNQRFKMNYGYQHIFMTTGAAGALAHAFRAVTQPGDQIIGFAPFFPEYYPYTKFAGLDLKVVPLQADFQIDFQKLDEMFNPKVTAVLINSPNNPSGVIYQEEVLQKLSSFLVEKQKEYQHDIFLISDEPYREIVFNNQTCPYSGKYYPNTLSCYSFSKSLSLPGERIGYIAVNPQAKDAEIMAVVFGQISRGIGHNCPPSMIQLGVAEVIDQTSDLTVYEKNMTLIYDKLVELGFEVNKPDGTFYIMPKALEADSILFCQKALKYDLVFVPADGFGAPGYFRMAYCIDTEKVRRSLAVIEKFVRAEYSK